MMDFNDILGAYPPKLISFRRNILREYLQYKVLQVLFGSKYATKLVFLGGTALRIVHNNSRFSEDLDFDNFDLDQAEFEDLAVVVKKALELEGYAVETRTVFKKAFRCYIRFPKLLYDQGLSPLEEEKILIQLDIYGHGFSYLPERVILNKFDVFTEILVTPIDILLSQKIFAALSRKRAKGRDFYDIVYLLGKTKPNYEYLKLKIDVSNARALRQKMLKQFNGLNFDRLAQEVRPFLFSPEESKRVELFIDYMATVEL